MRFAKLSLAVAVMTSTLVVPSLAHADTKTWADDAPGFYLYGSPIFMGVPLGDDDVTDVIEVSYQWGLGLGGFFPATDTFGIGIGFGFEHNPATLDGDIADGCEFTNTTCEVHAFRMLAELRLGGMLDELFVYGYVAPGAGVTYTSFRRGGFFGGTSSDADPGFNVGLGGGAQYIVYEGLFVGGELGLDFGIFTNDEVDIGDDDYGVYLMDLKGIIGYLF